jgi:hypothetical protein
MWQCRLSLVVLGVWAAVVSSKCTLQEHLDLLTAKWLKPGMSGQLTSLHVFSLPLLPPGLFLLLSVVPPCQMPSGVTELEPVRSQCCRVLAQGDQGAVLATAVPIMVAQGY